MELKDEVAIVTGGGYGIGEAVSLKLASLGQSFESFRIALW